jgi:NADP-dependent 3-hydroxy acid dehydrogenase YdfG
MQSKLAKALIVTGASSPVAMQMLEGVMDKYSKIYALCHTQAPLLHSKFGTHQGFNCLNTDLKQQKIPWHNEWKQDPIHYDVIHLAASPMQLLPLHQITPEDLMLELNLQLGSLQQILSIILPIMQRTHYGKIILMQSIYMQEGFPAGTGLHSISKHALNGFLQTIFTEYTTKGISVCALGPSFMETPFVQHIPKFVLERERAKFGPFLLPSAVGNFLVWLLQNDWESGTFFPIKSKDYQ